MKPTSRPELIFALVGATGTRLEIVESMLRKALADVSYETKTIRLSAILNELPSYSSKLSGTATEADRIAAAMDAGDELRETTKRGDALAVLACMGIRSHREGVTGSTSKPAPNTAYILRSLKHPQEVATLRAIYGSSFYLIGAYSKRPNRVTNLATRIAEGENSNLIDSYRSDAERLIVRDQEETGRKLGQQLRETFPLSDVFVDADDEQRVESAISRFVDIIFRHPFHTPTKDEYGMFHAQAAALRSAALGRQVGATICTKKGEVVAVGTNEVPKAGGGSYWSDDDEDHRDFRLKYDSMDRFKRQMVGEFLDRLIKAGWLQPSKAKEDLGILVEESIGGILKGAQVLNVLEYGRIVHAEMAAITEAARRGVQILDCTLFTTTFPCHNCARHIVSAGLARVVYIEPYPKSMTSVLHTDAVTHDDSSSAIGRILFEPFVGIAPIKYMDFFQMVERKKSDGSIVEFSASTAFPRAEYPASAYLTQETLEINALGEILQQHNLFSKKVS